MYFKSYGWRKNPAKPKKCHFEAFKVATSEMPKQRPHWDKFPEVLKRAYLSQIILIVILVSNKKFLREQRFYFSVSIMKAKHNFFKN